MARVLFVDDDRELVAAHKALMEKKGFEVSVAYSGQEGWDSLLASRPDVVVLDCMMEEFTSGFELAQDINLKFPDLPILVLTSVHDHMSSAWSFGPDDEKWLPIRKWMEKPVPPARLVAAVQELLEAAQSTGAARSS